MLLKLFLPQLHRVIHSGNYDNKNEPGYLKSILRVTIFVRYFMTNNYVPLLLVCYGSITAGMKYA